VAEAKRVSAAVVLAEDPSRYLRAFDFHPYENFQALPGRKQVALLKGLAGGLPLTVLVGPRSTLGEVATFRDGRGKEASSCRSKSFVDKELRTPSAPSVDFGRRDSEEQRRREHYYAEQRRRRG
jgi:hypothetical protein